MNIVRRTLDFFHVDVWRIAARDLPRPHSFLLRLLRVILLTLRGFQHDQCALKASAMTFYSILSVVPVAAMAFGVAKGFGFERLLEERIQDAMKAQPEVATRVIEFSRNFLKDAQGGVIAGLGMALLLYTIIRVLSGIEDSFNDIWGVKEPRSLVRKFTDYLSVILVCPLLFVMSSGLTVIVSSKIEAVVNHFALLGPLGPYIFTLLKLMPLFLVWALFSFLYIFMPNTKVNTGAAVFAGVIGGTLFWIVQWIYIVCQVGVSKYGAIYGSFAALPLFLVWLQTSWIVVLFGAEFAFAHQNVETYEFEPDCLSISHSFKTLLALWVARILIGDFIEGKKPATASQLSHETGIPIRLAKDILFELVAAGILSETRIPESKDCGYQPARSVDALTLRHVLDALERRGTDTLPVKRTDALDRLSARITQFGEAAAKSPDNILLRDI